MNAQVPDFPEHVEKTEPIRQKQLMPDQDWEQADDLERLARDVIEELEFILEEKSDRTPNEFIFDIALEAQRIISWVNKNAI